MKKLFLLTLTALIVLALCACASSGNTEAEEPVREIVAESAPEPTVEPTPKPTPEPTLEPTPAAEISISQQTYLDAISATKADLTGSAGEWYYNGIPLLSEDCEWIDNPLNADGTVSQGVVYRKFAYMLSMSDFEKGRFMYSYKDISEILLGFIPDTVDDYIPLAQNASEFIVTEDQIQAIMQEFQSLESVSGEFDFEYQKFGKYSLDILDLSACANEMQISEEMLGYILAMLDEYGPTITFEGNSCHIEYNSPV